jgi:transposase-like protein
VCILVDRGSGDRYVLPTKAADESTFRLLLVDRQQESLTVYTDGFLVMNHSRRTAHSTANTSSTETADTLTETHM